MRIHSINLWMFCLFIPGSIADGAMIFTIPAWTGNVNEKQENIIKGMFLVG